MTRRLFAALIILASLSLQGQEAASRSTSATMNVSAHVLARTIVTIDEEPQQVVVTDDDIRRGYVELPSALRFSVRSNARDGYLLEFSQLAPAFRRMSVRWDSTEVQLGGDGAVIMQPATRGQVYRVADVRLELAQGTRPGVYGWGVRVNGSALN